MTSAQKSRCRELAQALDRGDMAAYRRAEPALTPEMRGEVWDQRAHVKAMAARGHKTLPPTDGKVSAAVMHDLDYWSDDVTPDHDDDNDGDVPCAACNGRGKDAAGNRCAVCGGSGKVAPGDDDGNEDDENDDED